MSKLVYVLAASAAALSLGTVQAMAVDVPFRTADANADGYVSFAEAFGIYPTLPKFLFERVDENKDGRLDESEYTELEGLSAILTTNYEPS